MARLAVQRGKMSTNDEQIIQRYTQDIEKELETNDVSGPLFSRFIIDEHDKEFIESARESRTERARRLISRLILRGPKAFMGFIESLEAAGYTQLVSKLKGETILRKDPNDSLRNWRQGQYLTERVDILSNRIGELDKKKVNKEIVKDLSKTVKDMTTDIDDIKQIVQRVEELTRASKENENTTNLLREQLREKEKMLAEAREKIDNLEGKVEDLEQINQELRVELDKQNQRVKTLEDKATKQELDIDELKQSSEAEKQLREKELEVAREERKRNEESRQEQDRQIKAMQETVQSLKQATVSRPSPRRQQFTTAMSCTKLEPKNRFQPERKYKK